MIAHAERTYPEECCGLLMGYVDRQSAPERRTLVEVFPVVNAWSLTVANELATVIPEALAGLKRAKTERYWIDPRDLLQAQRYARDRQFRVIGVYHSHPDHVAIPSECDRRLAWPHYSYLIVSVHQGKSQETHSWYLDDRQQFQSETLLIQD
ncbi:M67 family metallopeptidase [Thermocoleostomius sinensis]|uniref:M67 family metallopeptidase n=1 Tax=Thermocoleostomius sinensis A174 TaxID=2016057 RepID=A0A9E8ZA38_9CYAN|nr:M67 family metallopeptidase [Thermocoleostomius sinensis]WAL58184.1 M67 family metallopeptidase [Thermocoleostomius sinensis A174]